MKNRGDYIARIYLVFVLLFTSISLSTASLPLEVKAESNPIPDSQEVNYQLFLPLITSKPAALPVLTIWTMPDIRDSIRQIALDFEATYKVDVIVEAKENLRDDFASAAPAGEGPDLAIFPHDQIAYLVASGLLGSIEIGSKTAEFAPSALQAITNANHYYGLPFSMENLALVYNKDLIDTPPTTWEALHTLGQSLQLSGKVDWGFVLTGTTYDAYPLMTAQGGYVFGKNPDGSWNTDDLGIGSAGMIAFGETIKTWVAEEFMTPSIDWSNSHALFETGEVPWIMAGPWALGRIRASGVNYGITNFPSGYAFSGVQAFVVSVFSDQKVLAEQFLVEYVATTDTMDELSDLTNRIPTYLSALNLVDDPDLKAFGLAGINAEPMPAIPEMGCVWGPWDVALRSIIDGTKTPSEAYTLAATSIHSCIDLPLTGMVNVPGSFQSEVGCSLDWDPACSATALVEGSEGLYSGTFEIPAGSWECKVALDGSWTKNYGVGGEPEGDNYLFTTTATSNVTFVYHSDSHILDIILP